MDAGGTGEKTGFWGMNCRTQVDGFKLRWPGSMGGHRPAGPSPGISPGGSAVAVRAFRLGTPIGMSEPPQ